MVIVSACLAGLNCRYDADNSLSEKIAAMVRAGNALPLCPEQLGGLPTPRSPSEISSGDGFDVISAKARVVNSSGADVTECYLKGAREVLGIARIISAEAVLLKEKSPACGVRFIVRGGARVKGPGVCAAMLVNAGFFVCGEGEK